MSVSVSVFAVRFYLRLCLCLCLSMCMWERDWWNGGLVFVHTFFAGFAFWYFCSKLFNSITLGADWIVPSLPKMNNKVNEENIFFFYYCYPVPTLLSSSPSILWFFDSKDSPTHATHAISWKGSIQNCLLRKKEKTKLT